MAPEPEPRHSPAPLPPRPGAPRQPALSAATLLGTCLAAALGIAALVELKRPADDPFAALDTLYLAWREPAPPPGCRDGSAASRLADIATDADALRALARPSPEASYLLARATFGKGHEDRALERAASCPGFAAAELLAGRAALAAGDRSLARAHLERAVTAAPHFAEARATRAGVLIDQGALEEALAEGEALITAEPAFAGGFLVRARARAGLQARATDAGLAPDDPPAELRSDLCTAARLGSAQARELLGGAVCP